MRDSSTRVYTINRNDYKRPKYLKGHQVAIGQGETIELTTPYGGTIMLYPQSSQQTGTVSFSIEGAAEHAYIDDMTKIDEYGEDLKNTKLPWTQIKTPMMQIHSRTDFMRSVGDNEIYNGDIGRYVDDVMTFMVKGAYKLTGLNYDGVDISTEVKNFCDESKWSCFGDKPAPIRRVQHINSDTHTACGSACSGNPIDISSPIEPTSWGIAHEIGHNLQPLRLRIYGRGSSEVSNNIFPLHARMKYDEKYGKGTTGSGKDSNYKNTFTHIQAAKKAGNIPNIWSLGNDSKLNFYMQIMHKGYELTSLKDGWDIFTLLYLQDREFSKTRKNWSEDKDKIGFSMYDKYPSKISANDFMLISLSFITKEDQRPFFDSWGVSYSDDAVRQVESYEYPKTKDVFYLPENQSYKEPIKYRLVLDGKTAWPL